MNRIRFYLPVFLILLMFLAKLSFFQNDPESTINIWGILSSTSMVFLFIGACLSYFSEKIEFKKNSITFNAPSKIVLVGILAVLSFSFYFTAIKVSPDWDAVALYDARAKFLQAGIKFSEMLQLSQFDSKNAYYYLLYPPFTSVIHWLSYASGFHSTHMLYPLQLALLAIGIYALTYRRLGHLSSLILCLLCLGQEQIFLTSMMSYTNMPYTLYLSIGIFLLVEFLHEKRIWQFFLGIILISTSQWIRFLEPNWIPICLAFLVVLIKLPEKIIKKVVLSSIFLGLGFFEYQAWNSFVLNARSNQSIFSFSLISLSEPLIGLFTGSFLRMLTAYIGMWGSTIYTIFASLLALKKKTISHTEKNVHLFLRLLIIGSFVLYFGGLYFISFQVDWWREMGGSLVRSTTFLIPVANYLILQELRNFQLAVRNK